VLPVAVACVWWQICFDIQCFICVEQEREQSLAELESIKKELISERTEAERLVDLVRKVQDDKRRLALKVNKMMTTGQLSFFYCWLSCLNNLAIIIS